MKVRIMSVSVFGTLVFLLVMVFCVQGAKVSADNQLSESALFVNQIGDFSPNTLNSVGLGHTSPITFTPAYTIHLPMVARNFSKYGFHPGQILPDPEMDVSLACIDVVALNSSLSENTLNSALSGQMLQATFDLRDVPTELTFNRIGVPQNASEYQWSVYVDVDNDPETGSDSDRYKGAEYSLGAMHFVFSPDSPISQSIPSGVQVNTWEYHPETGHWHYLESATIEVNAEKDTMTLTGEIPGITSESRLFFVTFNYNPGGEREWDITSYSASTGQELQYKSNIQCQFNGNIAWRWIPITDNRRQVER